MDFLTSLFARDGFMPHGYCFTWSPGLLWSMVGADVVIAAAYFSIPAAILNFTRKRDDPAINGLALMFSAFIFACGITHVMDVWTIWHADYGLQALTKTVTAAISLATAVALWPLIPKALKVPSAHRLQSVITTLEAEIARRRAAEDQVVDIGQDLAVALVAVGAGFIATDRDGRVKRMNAVAEQVLGWSEAEANGHVLWEVFDREDRPAAYKAMNPVDVMLQQRIGVDTVHRVVAISRDGRRTPLEVQAEVTRAGDGSVLGLAVIFRDVTRLVSAEAESSRLAAIVESSNDAIIGKTLDGRITSWNGAAERMFGYGADEAIGQPIQMLIPPERAAEEMRILADLAQGKQINAFDTVRRGKDGTPLDVSITISPIRDAHGRIVGASKIARDVSHQRRAEAALRHGEAQQRLAEDARLTARRLEAENRQIHEASRAKSQFLANMSHELRTPLNAVIGFADLLHSGAVPADSPKHRKFLGHIGTSGRHLLQLINDVLDLSKVESGKFEFYPEPVQLSAIVKEVTDVLHTDIVRKRIGISTAIDVSLGALSLDPARLKQVLYNYLSNAIKFTPEGGRVSVRARAEGDSRFRLEVEDSGMGIAADDVPRLFSEFEQLDAGYSKRHQGTGLGLALTRRLVEAQGGSVGVRSVLGVGSVFHVVLDRVHGSPVPTAVLPVPADTPPTQRILVIEHDPPTRHGVAQALLASGFAVDAAATAGEAIRQASVTAYNALTLNLKLPDQHGLVALANIRGRGASQTTPVSGLTMTGEAQAAASFAVADVLLKPIRSDEVLAAVSRFRLSPPRRTRVMVVDDDALARDLLAALLQSIAVDCIGIADAHEALRDIDRHRPDAIVLDLMMPGFNGFEMLDALRRLPAWRSVPVFIWTGMELTEAEYATLARSASEILSKGGGSVTGLLEIMQRARSSQPAVEVRRDE